MPACIRHPCDLNVKQIHGIFSESQIFIDNSVSNAHAQTLIFYLQHSVVITASVCNHINMANNQKVQFWHRLNLTLIKLKGGQYPFRALSCVSNNTISAKQSGEWQPANGYAGKF